MLCPRCNTVNKDNAMQCRECGTRLANIRTTREASVTEGKYLIAGIVSFIAIILILVLIISSVSCIVGDSCKNAGEDYINESVDGDWSAEIPVSGGDVVSSADQAAGTQAPSE